MDEKGLRQLLGRLRDGSLTEDGAVRELLQSRDLGFARVDHAREARCGFPEVVYCEGKTPADAARIATEILSRSERLLMTRADAVVFEALCAEIPDAVYHERARCVTVLRGEPEPEEGLVGILCAGTSDIAVAEEARVSAEILGAKVETHYDVGVAGLHRLAGAMDSLAAARALVVVAGMEGALPSVVGGLVARPVIAVPTSVGYGASFGGLAALLAMLNSCAAGVSVVNIDNGFGAGYLAALINRSSTAPAPQGKHEPADGR
ncbi:MAG: nickel pincer cofactor biosynthesis protein LarB [Planctomycetota bacterium]